MPLVLAGLAVAILVMLLFGNTELDRSLLIILHADAGPAMVRWSEALAWSTGPAPLLALAGAAAGFLCYRRAWRDGLLLLAMVGGGMMLAGVLGMITAGLRPGPANLLFEGQQGAFPDPRTAGVTVTTLALAAILARPERWRDLAIFAATLISFGCGVVRLVLGAAWPSDVIGGWALALLWTLLLLRVAGTGEEAAAPPRFGTR